MYSSLISLRCSSLFFIFALLFVGSLNGLWGQNVEIPLIANGGPTADAKILPLSSKVYAFPQLPRQMVTLEIISRFQAPAQMGSNPRLKIWVNGQLVTAVKNRGMGRLKNKSLISKVSPNLIAPWYYPYGWRQIFAPDFSPLPSHYEDNPYRLVLDITDLVHASGANTLELANIGAPGSIPNSDCCIYINKLSIHSQPALLSQTMLPALAANEYINEGTPAKGAATYWGTLHSGGGFSIQVGSQNWSFFSSYSYPHAGFNVLAPHSPQDPTGQAAWTVQASPTSNGGTVVAQAAGYRVDRTVTFAPGKVLISDTITNLTASPLPIVVRNEADLTGRENAPVRLAGFADRMLGSTEINDYHAPGNPTVFIENGDRGVGILAEDKVYRNQAKLYIRPGEGRFHNGARIDIGHPRVGIKTETLRIPPNGTQALQWSVHPVMGDAKGVDYFDFINLVRAHWSVNAITVVGPWYWGFNPVSVASPSMTNQQVQAFFRDKGIRYAVTGGGWIDTRNLSIVGFGSGVFDSYWAPYRQDLVTAIQKIRSNSPNTRVLVYYNSQRDTLPMGHLIYEDSKRTLYSGNHDSTTWGGTFANTTYSYVPTSGLPYGNNLFGLAMEVTATRYMSEFGADGIYWDEMENIYFGAPLYTFNRSDGVSTLIDPLTLSTGQTILGLTQLLSEQHNITVAQSVLNYPLVHGGNSVILGNGPAATRDILNTGIQRMVEAQHNDLIPSEGHLQTPLAYLGGYANRENEVEFEHIQRLLVFGLLPVGARPSWQDKPNAPGEHYPVMPKMFPFTPIELHLGYLKGHERIITSHKGKYRWENDSSLVQVHYFDSDGQPQPMTYFTIVLPEGNYTDVTLSTETKRNQYTGPLVILERLPMTATAAGSTSVNGVSYTESEVKFKVFSVPGASITLRPGRFPIVHQANYRVEIKFSNGSTQVNTVQATGTPGSPQLTVSSPVGQTYLTYTITKI